MSNTAWKSDNYKFVGKAFDYAYANRLNKLLSIMGTDSVNSVDYDVIGYDVWNRRDDSAAERRGFRTLIKPEEFSLSESVGYKQAKIDKSGECSRVGRLLGNAAAITVCAHAHRMFANAFDKNCFGGDARPWAATDHPNVCKYENHKFTVDADAGTYSNLIAEKLSVGAINTAQHLAQSYVTQDGQPLLTDMHLLLVSPELEHTAMKICEANGSMQYMVIGSDGGGFAAKQWAICDPELMRKMVKIIYVTRPTLMQTALDNPLKDLYTSYVDFGCGWGDGRQIIFSNP